MRRSPTRRLKSACSVSVCASCPTFDSNSTTVFPHSALFAYQGQPRPCPGNACMPCLLCPQPRAASAPTCSARAERDYQVRSWHKGILADTSTPASRQGRTSRSSVMWSNTYPGIALQVPSKLGSARAKADRRATDSSCAASAQGAHKKRQSDFAVRAPAKPQTPHIRDGTSSPTQRGPCGRVRGQVVAVPCCVCRKAKALPWLHRAGQQRAMAPHGRRLCCNSQARTAQHAAHSQS